MTVPAALLAALTLAAAAPRAAVVVHTTGLPDADVQRIEDKVGAEIKATGAELWSLSRAVEVRAECLEDRGCAAEIITTADASFLVWVEILRAGARVQVSSRLLDAEGRVVTEDDGSLKADALLGAAPVIAAPVLAPLKNAVAAAPTTTSPTPVPDPGTGTGTSTSTGTGTSTQTTTGTVVAEPLRPEEPPAADDDALSPLAVGGIAALGVGTLLALGGVAVIPGQLDITRDPESLGTEKEAAAGVVVAAGAIAAIGAATAITGGVLLALGLQSEQPDPAP